MHPPTDHHSSEGHSPQHLTAMVTCGTRVCAARKHQTGKAEQGAQQQTQWPTPQILPGNSTSGNRLASCPRQMDV